MPQRPRSFRKRADYVALAVIVVACVAVATTVWAISDARHTTSKVGPAAVTTPQPPHSVPSALRVAWQAPSGATPVPVAVGATVVTGDHGAVLGRDPTSGKVRWSYTRNLSLCTVAPAWSMVLAVYRQGSGWCSEVSALHATTGARGPQRNGDADNHTRLIFDGTYVTATGRLLNDTWRSDLVQTMEYGKVPDFKNPHRQPHAGCVHTSTVAAGGAVGVVEHCGKHGAVRLSVYEATARNADQPNLRFSTKLSGNRPRVVAMTDTRVAVAFPDRLELRNARDGKLISSYPLHLPASDFAGDPPGLVVPTSSAAGSIQWYTGSATISLAGDTLRPQWTARGTLGPGTALAGKLLLPVPGGLAVTDPRTGHRTRTIRLDRGGYHGTVRMSTTGPVVLEERGDRLVALTGTD